MTAESPGFELLPEPPPARLVAGVLAATLVLGAMGGLLGGLLGGWLAAPAPPPDLSPRVAALEQEVTELRQAVVANHTRINQSLLRESMRAFNRALQSERGERGR